MSGVVTPELGAHSHHGARRTIIKAAMTAAVLVALAAAYACVQYVVARHQVAAFATKNGATNFDLSTHSIGCTASGASIMILWAVKTAGEQEPDIIVTWTSWMGLGRTRIPELRM